jgi:hypothetical protein
MCFRHVCILRPSEKTYLSGAQVYVWQQQTLFTFLETRLWIACIVCECALCIGLINRKLVGRYPCLFGLALVNAARDISLVSTSGTGTDNYPKIWTVTLPILMSVQVATVLEAYTKLTTQYPGLGVFASKLLRYCLALLVIASCISAAWDFHHIPASTIQAIFFMYRYFAFVMSGCLAFPCLVLSRFPKPDKQPARNIKMHLWMLVSYFCVYSLSCLAVNVTGMRETTITIFNVIMLFALCGLYGSWAFVLTAAGEVSLPWPHLRPELAALIDARHDAALQRGERLARSSRVRPQGDPGTIRDRSTSGLEQKQWGAAHMLPPRKSPTTKRQS